MWRFSVVCIYSQLHATLRLVNRIKEKALPVTMMLDFQPGESAQVDFGAGPKLVDSPTGHETKTDICYGLSLSRHMYVEIVLRQDKKPGWGVTAVHLQ